MRGTRVILRDETPWPVTVAPVALNITGFVDASVAAAFDELRKREGFSSLTLVELMIAERARAGGIYIPEVEAERRRRVTSEVTALIPDAQD